MKKLAVITFILMAGLVVGTVRADTYDAIVVRSSSDVIIDQVIAETYSHKAGVPVILTEPETLSTTARRALEGLKAQDAERILVIGGSQAVSDTVESEIRSMGYDVDRKWGTDRNVTAAIVAIDLWKSAENIILINGSVPESFLIALETSYKLKAPILLLEENEIPEATLEAIDQLNPKIIYVVGPKIPDISTLPGEKRYVGTDIEAKEIPEQGEEMSFDLLSLLIGSVIGGIIIFLVYRVYKRRISVEVPLFVLTEDERKIIDAIKTADDEMKQEDLPEKTGFSRPKVTKIIQDLENKKIISRAKYGKTYKVTLEKKFVKT